MSFLVKTFVLRTEGNAASLYSFLKLNWRAMADAGKPLSVIVSENKTTRSSEQNRRYWALMAAIHEQVWVSGRQYDPEVWHEHFKTLLAPKEESPSGFISISTARMDVEQFAAYMMAVEMHAATEFSVEFSL